MTLIHRVPTEPTPPIDRPVHREQCPCGRTFIGPKADIWRIWVTAHAKHWEDDDA